jgi:NTP pyrophosphatase (non-canonical NTP hydrolase)
MKDRPIMKEANHSSLPALLGLLSDEVKEAIETIESGDAIIEDKYVAIEQELADIGLFLLTAFDILGSDPFKAMMEKHARNMLKYPANLFQDGDFQSSLASAKKMWRDSGGNHDFYNGHSVHMIDFDADREQPEVVNE